MAKSFGDLVHMRRIALNLTLRKFCLENDFDPAYISRIENNIIPAPAKDDVLKKLAKSLKYKEASEEWNEFIALASISRGEIPVRLNKRVVKLLPALCRKEDGSELSEEEIRELINIIKGKDE